MSKAYQCVIFDWDGTLMNSEARIVASVQYAAQQAGFPVLSAHESKQIIGLSLENAILTLYPQATTQDVALMSNAYTEFFLEHCDVEMAPFSGAEALLADLKAQNVKLAIATGKSRKGLNQVLAETGFDAYFDFTRTPVESESKPSPLMLQQILEEFGLSVEQAVMVGDTEFDMQMARNIKMDAVALSHGVHELDVLKKHEPVECFDDLHSMREWLKQNIQAYSA
ncbi:MAG: HAD-IA family hydrolase [Hydrogenovibrio sp.]|nr:HAD-IA family hydrolase [Hydrogenovibrio sp.]